MKVLKKFITFLAAATLLLITACSDKSQSQSSSETALSVTTTTALTSGTELVTDNTALEYASELLQEERNSIIIGKLSSEHIYYQAVVALYPECAEYITEISIYDKEIDDTFVVHVSLPPEYDSNKKYPMIVMTDGVWRLSDHPELRPLMVNGEIEDVILVSVGYPNDYDFLNIRQRDLFGNPDRYLHFIVDNLMPFLCEEYSVDSDNLTLTGHSYGGYWAFYSLFNCDTIGKNTFKNYYIGSPSFQARTNSKDIAYFEEQYFSRNKTLDCNVYISVGGYEPSGFIKPISDFAEFLQTRDYSNLEVTYEIIEGLDHNTVYKPSIHKMLLMFYGKNNQ